jgi:hypothetical protein
MVVITASGEAHAHEVILEEIEALGQSRSAFPVIAVDVPSSLGVDGLLGLDFFRSPSAY